METMIQPKVTGYRQLSEAEVELMNEGKALAAACGEYLAKLRAFPATPASGTPFLTDAADNAPSRPSLDQRWVSIGATDIQRGFMAVIRGIAQPTTF
jgi:hypothetical protein